MRDTFHQTAITHEYISEVVNDIVTSLLNCAARDFSAIAIPTALVMP
ncbi:hypothetical protein JCM19240_5952 [Vibrio maritimus]|uniref:Uncharacterized protein n=1 Tax=Vibrio maritimus TaxID=990268 RepID=A0A090SXP4_9VIBR|nr:hypothetical protein JCM19240_5952 [Vibrio maritimus]